MKELISCGGCDLVIDPVKEEFIRFNKIYLCPLCSARVLQKLSKKIYVPTSNIRDLIAAEKKGSTSYLNIYNVGELDDTVTQPVKKFSEAMNDRMKRKQEAFTPKYIKI